MMPLSFIDGVTQAIHFNCAKEHIAVRIDVPMKYEEKRLMFLWRRDVNGSRELVIEHRWRILPGGFMLLEAFAEGAYRIRRGMTGGVEDKLGFMPWIIRMPMPQYEQN